MKVYTPEELAKVLGVSRLTVYSWLKKGLIPGAKIGRLWRISEDALREFLNKHTKVKK